MMDAFVTQPTVNKLKTKMINSHPFFKTEFSADKTVSQQMSHTICDS